MERKGGKGLRDEKGGVSYTLERRGWWNGFSRGFLADEHFWLSVSRIFANFKSEEKFLFSPMCVRKFPIGGSLVDTGSVVIWLGFLAWSIYFCGFDHWYLYNTGTCPELWMLKRGLKKDLSLPEPWLLEIACLWPHLVRDVPVRDVPALEGHSGLRTH